MIFLACTTALAPTLVSAEGTWTLGLGVGGAANVYRGHKDDTYVIPDLSYETERFRFGFDGFSYKLVSNEALSFSVLLALGEKPDFEDYAKKDARFAGLKRDLPIELGVAAEYNFGLFHLGAAALHDVASASDGYHVEASAGLSFPVGSGMIDVGLGARMRDGKLNNFLYGVAASEANGLRAAYDVGRTVEPFLELSLAYPLTDRLSVVGAFDYTILDEKVRKSPLVDAKESYSIGLGIAYSF
ncbi:MipA/OmpV family protein [Frigidibacter sp. RF13]|uniref:MipA/OmpV family protein n=1 Tax=Frigidibacter sp. RF13 TaxID=2997340 RepID=UPI00226F895B|nr:MipA/OmpV family protein [Frigidibacter sp. RF13]MCY1127041.1 MipA/OmpV family protein [Frigidibacter sp. RF13]